MGTTDVLRSSVRSAHAAQAERLDAARSGGPGPGGPRDGYERIDTFLATTSQHLHAVDAVLLAQAQGTLAGCGELVRDYLSSTKELEVVLAHVKAHEYGSVYESSFAWPRVWGDVDIALADHHRQEDRLTERLTEALDDRQLEDLTERLREAEVRAPSRPHPYTPHTGPLGRVARTVMHVADRFWDTVEGRMVPEPERPAKKPPGLVAQYFLADPRFDEDQPPPGSRG